jgi:hypothetical protein
MSCINIEVTRIGRPLSCSAERVGEPLKVSASRIGKPMQISCGLVCTTENGFYLRVMPDVIWLRPDSAEVEVQSNVSWRIE